MFLTKKAPQRINLAYKIYRSFSSVPNVVQIEYKDVMENKKTLFPLIEEAYCEDGIGLLVVNNLPGFPEKRKRLLPFAQKLAKLDQKVLKSLECPEKFFSVGWSHGKEKFMGKPDMLKGSYYCNPINDEFDMADSKGVVSHYSNVWPKPGELDGLEEAFKDLGGFINKVGIQLAKNLDKFIKHRWKQYQDGLMEKHLKESLRPTGRLLHYFPVDKEVDMTNMKWWGWHNDHGTLTGLCSAMYLDKDFNEVKPQDIEDKVSGLFAMTRHHVEVQVKIPQNSLAFQIGETGQIISGGVLWATPHSVVSKPSTSGISRNTFALFMEPNSNVVLNAPKGVDTKNVYKKYPTDQVPLIGERWKDGYSFGEFENRTFAEYYKQNN